MKRIKIIVLALLSMIVTVSCSQQPQYSIQKLPSGDEIKLAGIGKVHFSNDDPALMLTYYTDLNLEDKKILQSEVEKIWEVFKFDVEKSGLNLAFIKASELPKGFIYTSHAFTFGFEKDDQGNWIISNTQK